MSEVLRIDTERQGVILRQHSNEVDDMACFEAIQEDPSHVNIYGNRVAERYSTLDEARKTRLNAGDELLMGIWDNGSFKGNVEAIPNEDKTEAEIAVWLRASATGHGYATLAIKTMTEYLKSKFNRVFAEVHENNQASLELMKRAGYKKVGEVERSWGHAIVFEAS